MKESTKFVDNWEEMTVIPRKKIEEDIELTEAQNVLKSVKESLGRGSTLLLFWDIPARSETLKEKNIESEEALRALSDEELAAWGFPSGLIEEIRKVLG